VFLDECGVTTDLIRWYGQRARGRAWRALRNRPSSTARLTIPRFSPTSTPPYSPVFNLIEQAFAKLKAFLRAMRPRTFEHVCELIAAALGLFIPHECANFIRRCDYHVSTLQWKTLQASIAYCFRSSRF
jgi:hypothetical protein